MNKNKILIPQGIEYISEWKDYSLPKGEHCIVDKGVTGCGYTEFALNNEDPVVLCSPRKLLLENKFEKHAKLKHFNIIYLDSLSLEVMTEVVENQLKYCQEKGLIPKFLITYDSTGKIIECLKRFNCLDDFIFVVDEFQSIFLDSYFKPGVEFDFVNNLQECLSVIYLSATPMLDKYLEKLDDFKNLPFYKIDWSNSGFVETITVGRKRTNSLTSECSKIVNDYLDGKYPMILDKNNGKIVQSKEAVFYFNSILEILRVIRKCELTPDNTLIFCSKSERTLQKLRKAGFSYGKIPLEDEPNPMFTFCTSAVYMGVDFFSECASSFVFADPNIDCLALDISLDLPQIIGRQRNKNNPFKNYISMFYKIKRKGELDLTEENFRDNQNKKRESTKNLINIYNNLLNSGERSDYIQKLLESIEFSKYKKDFISISEKTGAPVHNVLIELADERAWEVSRKDYQDTISVTKAIYNLEKVETEVMKYRDKDEVILNDFLKNQFFKTSLFHERMKLFCEFADEHKDNQFIIDGLFKRVSEICELFPQFYNYYGTSGCSSRKYQKSELIKGWKDNTKLDKLRELIYSEFKEGDRITLSNAKSRLSNIYEKLSLSKKAKASDLGDYFELSKTNAKDSTGVFKTGINLKKKLL